MLKHQTLGSPLPNSINILLMLCIATEPADQIWVNDYDIRVEYYIWDF